jgi:3'-phosphoadenosine 5'-phosphosulfate (PAPS) 3'-phosphatase
MCILALIEVYFWTLSIVWCPRTKKIIDKELKTPKRPKYKPQNKKPEQTHTYKTQNAKRPKYKPQNSKPEQTHTHTQNTKPEYTNGNKTTHDISETGCFRPQVETYNGDLLSYKYPRSG